MYMISTLSISQPGFQFRNAATPVTPMKNDQVHGTPAPGLEEPA